LQASLRRAPDFQWTRKRQPVEFVWRQEFPTRDEARAAELQIKKWNRAKKAALIAGKFELLHILAGRSKLSRAVRDLSMHKCICRPNGRLNMTLAHHHGTWRFRGNFLRNLPDLAQFTPEAILFPGYRSLSHLLLPALLVVFTTAQFAQISVQLRLSANMKYKIPLPRNGNHNF
jgi:hypothetical protein